MADKNANTEAALPRRRLLETGATLAAGMALGGCARSEDSGAPAAHTTERVRWRLASSFPQSLDTIYGSAEVLAQRVSEMTGGNFEIRVYQAGELVPGFGVMDAVQQGTVQCGHTASYYYTGKNPALALDTCVPFGMTARQQGAWLEEMGGRELVNELFADFGIRTFAAGNTGTQMGGWFRREIGGANDLAGLKIRIPGMGGEVMNALGASVQVIPGGEIFPALERGAIDATEWVGPYDDEKLGFHKVAKNYYYPGWWEPGQSLSFFVNDEEWNKLPSTYKAVFRTACTQAAATMQERYDAKNPPALQRLIAAGVQLRPFSNDLMGAARTASADLLADMTKDADAARILASWEAAKKDAFGWFKTAELAYANFAFGS